MPNFAARLKTNGLIDSDPYETMQDIMLFSELGDNEHEKNYLPEFEIDSTRFLTVNGKNPGMDPYGRAPLHSILWQFPRETAPNSFENINFILYEVSQVNESYTFAANPVTDNIVAMSVQHGR